MIASARQLLQQVEPIRHAAKGETGNLEHYVCMLSFLFVWLSKSQLALIAVVDFYYLLVY